jgi:hypothetical protein
MVTEQGLDATAKFHGRSASDPKMYMLEEYYWIVFKDTKLPPHMRTWANKSEDNYNSLMTWLNAEITKSATGSYPKEVASIAHPILDDSSAADKVFIRNLRTLATISSKHLSSKIKNNFLLEFYESPLWEEDSKIRLIETFLSTPEGSYTLASSKTKEDFMSLEDFNNPYMNDLFFKFDKCSKAFIHLCLPSDPAESELLRLVRPVFLAVASNWKIGYNVQTNTFVLT